MEILLFCLTMLTAAVLQLILCRRAARIWLRILPAALCAALLLYAALRFFGVIVYPGDTGFFFDRSFTTGLTLGIAGLAVLLGIAGGWLLHFIRDWRNQQ